MFYCVKVTFNSLNVILVKVSNGFMFCAGAKDQLIIFNSESFSTALHSGCFIKTILNVTISMCFNPHSTYN